MRADERLVHRDDVVEGEPGARDVDDPVGRWAGGGRRRHATAARIGATLALRLANADVLPYDYAEFARTMRRNLPHVETAARARTPGLDAAPLGEAIGRMEDAGSGSPAVISI